MKEFNVDGIDTILNVLSALPQNADVVIETGDFGPTVCYEPANCFRFNDWEENELGLHAHEPKNKILSVSQVISEIEKTSASKLILVDDDKVKRIIQVDNKDELKSFLQRRLPAAAVKSDCKAIVKAVKFPLVIVDL